MSKLKKVLLMCTAYVLVAALAIGGTFAYLQDDDSDVNVMTLGNVTIEQHEYERVEGAVKTIDGRDSYVLQPFTQAKPLYPIVGDPSLPGDNPAYAGFDSTVVRLTQVDSYGSMQVFAGKNAQDKFVTVENTGKTDAYVRTLVALEVGDLDTAEFDDVIGISSRSTKNENDFNQPWFKKTVGVIEVDGNNYVLVEFIYHGAQTSSGMKHENGILPAGDTSYPNLCQVYIKSAATNEDMVALDGNKNGTYDILVVSQAVQAAGFADAATALDAAFGDITVNNHPWGDGPIHFPGYVYSQDELVAALAENGTAKLGASFAIDRELPVPADAVIDGDGHTLYRAGAKERSAEAYTGNFFNVAASATLELKNIVLDGGAIWTGEVNEVLQRGTVNSGITATGSLVVTNKNSTIILGEGAILQNNGGANAVNLPKSSNSKLIVDGGQIINNTSAAGAIWGGGAIVINSGKISHNHATSIGGAIRAVSTMGSFTMNGGEMNHNYSNGTGGAIWGGNSAKYYLNGGEMAYNGAASAGGAIWTGTYEAYYISGDFKLHDNSCGENIGGAIRFADRASLTMTGGSVYGNKANGQSNAFYLNNNSASITGGSIADNFSYSGGLGLTWGEADVDGVIAFSLGTNHNTAYLAETFGTLKFTVNENATNFAKFNFKPAAGYTYAEGDEAKLICMNDGYETYWDAATGTFRLNAK